MSPHCGSISGAPIGISRGAIPIRDRNRGFGGCCGVCEVRGTRSRSSVLPDRGDCGCLVLRIVRGDERLCSNSPLGVRRDVAVRSCCRCRVQVERMDCRRGVGGPWHLRCRSWPHYRERLAAAWCRPRVLVRRRNRGLAPELYEEGWRRKWPLSTESAYTDSDGRFRVRVPVNATWR